ncbi:hypothetical protein Pla108_28400 [Botrimarina colliarenosi]|uniref:Uncharacterized protein n=1 Tax=Botrimarina colliarenosi TaxID=2528001 RepID=A0A5C6AFS0_9BACT|nr:hypothetical protein [Botrimarina colliarenosi]TWT97063.1 hypothetical protein Pla108_28400 [Botrimarina colliarenosi]
MPKRFRLATLVVLGPLLALVVALGSWVLTLRSQVSDLEQRVTVLEQAPPAGALASDYSAVGVHYDIDHAMQMAPMTRQRKY